MTTELSTSQTMVLIEILKILRNDENKIARKKIYELFMDKKIDDINSLDKQTILFIEKLYGDFDEIGFLVEEFKIKEILNRPPSSRMYIMLPFVKKIKLFCCHS